MVEVGVSSFLFVIKVVLAVKVGNAKFGEYLYAILSLFSTESEGSSSIEIFFSGFFDLFHLFGFALF